MKWFVIGLFILAVAIIGSGYIIDARPSGGDRGWTAAVLMFSGLAFLVVDGVVFVAWIVTRLMSGPGFWG